MGIQLSHGDHPSDSDSYKDGADHNVDGLYGDGETLIMMDTALILME